MYSNRNKLVILVILISGLLFSCQDLDELNINPNGVDPTIAHPNLLMSTVISSMGQTVVNLGFGDIAGVMQHTQKDGWSGSHNDYDWTPNQDWESFYGILRNEEAMYHKAKEMGLVFHQGVALIMKAYAYGMITDLWGDAPYTYALKGEEGGEDNICPPYDAQADIYGAILTDLDTANSLLSKKTSEYDGIDPVQDVLYKGKVENWRRFANSLALRYYMRLSEKDPATAQAGIEKIVGNPDTYPLILDANDDANMDYPGTNASDSWPSNAVFSQLKQGSYMRLKMCSTLVDTLEALGDPRLPLWANKIDIPIVVDSANADTTRDEIVDGIRYVGRYIAFKYDSTYGYSVDQDPNYVGMPPSWSVMPQAYNLNPNLEQAPHNPHVSHLNDRYKNASGPLLKSRMMTAAEVHFIIAEAALRGWTTEDAREHYEAGVRASLKAWGVVGDYGDYITHPGVVFDGTIQQVLEQKWIASWTAATEAWFDYRRTGYPALKAGPHAKRQALPLRFYYSVKELDFNSDNCRAAIDKLVETPYTAPDDLNSAWSKMWVLQGTGKPY
ncbi:MAG: SusD/RagB family nutrient-binding outer membrane lipoprotein [Bacteroidales bacterium]|nr:SusD/RagB family nutrient-binding outer membrane lipoprotein [Bacteroidales bacterium]